MSITLAVVTPVGRFHNPLFAILGLPYFGITLVSIEALPPLELCVHFLLGTTKCNTVLLLLALFHWTSSVPFCGLLVLLRLNVHARMHIMRELRGFVNEALNYAFSLLTAKWASGILYPRPKTSVLRACNLAFLWEANVIDSRFNNERVTGNNRLERLVSYVDKL